MEGIEKKCLDIIGAVSESRNTYIKAIHKARDYEFDTARSLVEEGNKAFLEGHTAHKELITREAKGDLGNVTMLLLHAEDQLMSAESFKIIAEEMISAYEKIQKLEMKVKWT